MHKKLVLCTIEYPYGNEETFLETEIIFLAKYFLNVYVLPSKAGFGERRIVPNNVIIIEDIGLKKEVYKPWKLIPFTASFLKIFIYSFLHSSKRISYIVWIKSLAHYFFNDFHKGVTLKDICEKYKLEDAVFYDYWFVNSGLAMIDLKRRGLISILVTRIHGFDLYNERNIEGIIPFREYKVKWVDRIYTISKHGETYLKNQIDRKYHAKIATHHLGVHPAKKIPTRANEKLILSCSSMIPLKSVDRIAKIIGEIKYPIRWIHFGDGADREKVCDIIKRFPGHIKVELRGLEPNDTIIQFYEENYVDLFISLSKSEGLPVSMMEVQSFGIPIIAPPINGISEIVDKTTGILLSVNYSDIEVLNSINSVLSGVCVFDRARIIDSFMQKFDANKNYDFFASQLAKLLDHR